MTDSADVFFDSRLRDDGLSRIRAALVGATDSEFAKEVTETLEQYGVLLELARTLSQDLSMNTLLPGLMHVITTALKADRATLFMYDTETKQLYSRIASGAPVEEIRIPADSGIAGAVFQTGQPLRIADVYEDDRFNPAVDRATGYRTQSMICTPVISASGEVLGVMQALNKVSGPFRDSDLALLSTISMYAAAALQQAQLVEQLEKARAQEARVMELMTAIASDLNFETLLGRIIEGTTELISADRGTFFLYDEDTDELWSLVAEGAGMTEIRLPSTAGIAGSVFTSGQTINIPDAYEDPRFNAAVDKATGYRTQSILSMPVCNKTGRIVGVIQVLNKKGGPFTVIDENRVRAFSSQVVSALENAQLFDEVLQLKNYNEGILKSLTNGVVTLDRDGTITKLNEAACRILKVEDNELEGRKASDFFSNSNPWIVRSIDYVAKTNNPDFHADTDLILSNGDSVAVNLNVVPLESVEGEKVVGSMLVLEDITREKRVRSTMSRYMAKEVVDRLLETGEDAMAGTTQEATVLFSDIRRFTSITEGLGTRQTVALLNEYFTEMVDVIFQHGGILDKYIGDAIMAVFGAPVTQPQDADNALRAANEMLQKLGDYNLRREKAGEEPIEIGIGLCTGEVVAGSIGSVRRMEYTVIGNTVNLAARLESANKHYGTRLLLSEATVDRLSSWADIREIDLMRAKGFSRPVKVYESIAHHPDDVRSMLQETVPIYLDGVNAYRAQNWSQAIEAFKQTLAECPDDGPSKIHLERCRYYMDNPPPEDWDGVWTMLEK